MNMANTLYEAQDADYIVTFERPKSSERIQTRSRRPSYSRGKNRPVVFNGIHRRHKKRISW